MMAAIDELIDIKQAEVQTVHLEELARKKISLDVLRLDRIHNIISGNKWFKLKYNLSQVIEGSRQSVVTFGGAYSNHILSTAFACAQFNLRSIGIIRGEKPKTFSVTLNEAMNYGMELKFISREAYRNKSLLNKQIREEFPGCFIIEEGGQNLSGIKGAEEISTLFQKDYSDICCSFGTGTMLAGLINSSSNNQVVTGFSSLKLNSDESTIKKFLQNNCSSDKNYVLNYDYHFGGYAKMNNELISFMNWFYKNAGIPTDFIYTGKLFFGILDLVNKKKIPPGSSIIAIHSGGLQGNRSLPFGILSW